MTQPSSEKPRVIWEGSAASTREDWSSLHHSPSRLRSLTHGFFPFLGKSNEGMWMIYIVDRRLVVHLQNDGANSSIFASRKISQEVQARKQMGAQEAAGCPTGRTPPAQSWGGRMGVGQGVPLASFPQPRVWGRRMGSCFLQRSTL